MIHTSRRRCLPALLSVLAATPLAGQLPLITTADRTFRFELGGAFNLTRDVWLNGNKVGVGDLLTGSLDASATPMVGDLQRDLTSLLGRAATPSSLGSLRTIADWQRNIGRISVAWGVTPKVTLFATAPIVLARTERTSTFDSSTSTLGLNPAHAAFGTSAGQSQTAQFFDAFNAALTDLNGRLGRGEYTGATLTLAQETAASSAQFMSALAGIVSSSGSPVLPLAASVDGAALLDRVAALRNTFTNSLGIAGFTGSPALPIAPLTSGDFNSLLLSPSGFDIRKTTGLPITTLGRLELGGTMEVFRRDAEAGGTSIVGWGRGVLRLGTGTAPSEFALLDQGTGGRQHQVELGGTLDLTRPRLGLRSDVAMTYSLAASGTDRLGSADQFLLPASRRTTISRSDGMALSISAQPWISVIPHLAFTGLVAYARRGNDHLSFAASSGAFAGLTAAELAQGTGMSSLRIGLGLNYYHDGRNHLGVQSMPVEAGWSIERTVSSGSGLVPAALTSTVYLRVYMPTKQ